MKDCLSFYFRPTGPETQSPLATEPGISGASLCWLCVPAGWNGADLGWSTQGQALLPELQAVGGGVKMVSASTSLNKEGECKNGSCQCFHLWEESQQFPGSPADALRLASKSPLNMV